MRISLTALLVMFMTAPALPQETPKVDFAHEVVPILKKHCVECHADGNYQGSLSFDTREMLLDAEAAIPGNADGSELIVRVIINDEFTQMPPEGDRLSKEEVETLKRWINAGLPWDDGFTFRAQQETVPLPLQSVELPSETAESGPHPIDRLLASYATAQEVELSPLADDATFLRRVYLDLLGILPPVALLNEFEADTRSDKRERMVQTVLDRKLDYAAHWMTFWNDLLRNDYVGTGYIDGGRQQITQWLHRALRENMPYDEFVRQLIAPEEESAGFAKGIIWRGRVNASQVPPLQFSQNVGQIFLGVNLKCASCHDSFTDNWKLADAYGLAAVVSAEPLELHRCDVPLGIMAEPKFLFPEIGSIDPAATPAERQAQLARLMTDPQNGRLPRTIVNRIWQRLMGYGLVEPVDAMALPAWHPELLEYLSRYLVEHKYDLKQLMAHITTSKAYQRRSVELETAPESGKFVFRGPLVKRMTAEQFVDALWTITGAGPTEPNAVIDIPSFRDEGSLPTVRAAFVTSDALMRTLGRPNREQVVTTRPDELTTLQALEFSNGPEFAALLDTGGKNLAESLSKTPKPSASAQPEQIVTLVRDLYLKALSRVPTENESQLASELLADQTAPDGIADLLWSILLLPEFQHIR